MMSSISFFRKMRLSTAAKRDAKGKYGEFLLYRWRKAQKEPPTAVPFQPSEFMERLVKGYTSRCKRIAARKICIRMLYSKILRQYEILSSSINDATSQRDQFNSQVAEFERTIGGIQSILDLSRGYWAAANQTGVVTPDMGVASLGALKQRITAFEKEISNLEGKKADLLVSSNSNKNAIDRQVKESRAPFSKLIAAYKSKIDSLYGIIDKVGSQYDEELSYYWHSLLRRLKNDNSRTPIAEPSKPFPEICLLCNAHLVQKTDLFSDERHIINTQIKNLVQFASIV